LSKRRRGKKGREEKGTEGKGTGTPRFAVGSSLEIVFCYSTKGAQTQRTEKRFTGGGQRGEGTEQGPEKKKTKKIFKVTRSGGGPMINL